MNDKVIYKYTLEITDTQLLHINKGAKLLHVANQNGNLILWAAVDVDEPIISRAISIHGTGHFVKNNELAHYIGTAQINPFVWHVFDLGER